MLPLLLPVTKLKLVAPTLVVRLPGYFSFVLLFPFTEVKHSDT